MKKTKIVTIRISPELKEKAKKYAEEHDTDVAKLMREPLREKIEGGVNG